VFLGFSNVVQIVFRIVLPIRKKPHHDDTPSVKNVDISPLLFKQVDETVLFAFGTGGDDTEMFAGTPGVVLFKGSAHCQALRIKW
jgi:hypothetical protein